MCTDLIGLNILFEGVKVPGCFTRGRSTSDKDGLEGVHGRREGVDDMHGDGSVIDVSSSVNNFFVNLVSEVHQHIQEVCD